MRTKVKNCRIPVIEFTEITNQFIFNLIKDECILRTIKITLVEAVGLYDNGFSINNYGLHLFHQFKWEELDLTDRSVVKNCTYFFVKYVEETLCDWLSATKFIVGKDSEIILNKEEIKRVWFQICYKIRPDVIIEPPQEAIIIRNEI